MFNLSKYLNEKYRFGLGNERRELLLRGNDLYDRYHYRLRDDDIPPLCIFLATCEVWYLDICYNRITDIGVCTLVKYLKDSSHELYCLNLMCNDIGLEGVQAICDLGPDMKIKSLRLNGNKFGPEGGKALSTFLLHNDNLQNLDIGETDQNIESIVYIAAVLRNPDTKLKSLNLSRPLLKFSEAHAAEILGQMLFMNINLKELILEKCGLSDHDIELLALGLQKYMDLRYFLPTPDPPAVKYKEAKSCSSYETVTSVKQYMKDRGLWDGVSSENLSDDNQVSSLEEIDINPLQRVMTNGSFVSYLRHLDLSCNNLSDFSIGYLGPYFLSKPPLVLLNLSFNLIGNDGAVELSRYLPSTIIEVLDVSHNTIDSEGIQKLIYRLKRPSKMRKLYIWGNPPNNSVCKFLKEVIEIGHILQENIDVKIYQVDGIDYAAFNHGCEDVRSEYYCVRKVPLHVYSQLSPCMQRLKETVEQARIENVRIDVCSRNKHFDC